MSSGLLFTTGFCSQQTMDSFVTCVWAYLCEIINRFYEDILGTIVMRDIVIINYVDTVTLQIKYRLTANRYSRN